MKVYSIFPFVAAAIITTTPAFAQVSQDADAEPFTGIYVGGSIGYDAQPNDVGSSILFDRNLDGTFGEPVNTIGGANAFAPGFCNGAARTQVPTNGCRNDHDDISYYGRVGLDKQIGLGGGSFLIGALAEFGTSKITDSVSGFSSTPASYILTRSVNWEGTASGRVGFVADQTLFYGRFGGGYAKIKHAFSTTNTANAFAGNGNDKVWGYVAGGGLEQKIARNISIGLEYTFHNYKDDNYRVRATAESSIAGSPVLLANNPFLIAPNTTGTDFARSDTNFRWHSVRATAALRF